MTEGLSKRLQLPEIPAYPRLAGMATCMAGGGQEAEGERVAYGLPFCSSTVEPRNLASPPTRWRFHRSWRTPFKTWRTVLRYPQNENAEN